MGLRHSWKRAWEGQTTPRFGQDTPEFYDRLGAELRMLFGDCSADAVLEIGCGNGVLYRPLGFDTARRYTGNDFSSTMIAEFARSFPDVRLHVGPGEEYEDDETYDLIISNGVIQYFDDRMLDAHLSRATRMLSDGGRIVCASVPWKQLRGSFYHGGLMGFRNAGMARALKARIRGLLGGYMGRWYDHRDIIRAARRHGLDAAFHGSFHMPYRFHAVLTRRDRRLPNEAFAPSAA